MDIVIFGVSGDLSVKKLFPTLSELFNKKKMPADTRVIGFSRSVKEIPEHPLEYAHMKGEYGSVEDMLKLKEMLRPDKKHLFYLALPPSAYRAVLTSLHEGELVTKDDPSGFRLILVEKPFGLGLDDARSLLSLAKEYFRPDQCLKVDHYAGKKELRELEEEDMANIKEIVFEITEKADVVGRAGFYDETGALRDVGQNHLLFMVSSFFKDFGAREEILSKLTLGQDIKDYLFGQYQGYISEEGVKPGSITETYFSIPAKLDIEELSHIKIRLIAGKAMSDNHARILITMSNDKQKEIRLSGGTPAYEHILEDAIQGKHFTFLSEGEVVEAWKFIEKVEKIKADAAFVTYPKGSDKITA